MKVVFCLYSLISTHLLFYKGPILSGFAAANFGFLVLARNEKDKEEFKKDSEMFSKTGEAIDELLGSTMEERERWLQLQNEFKGWTCTCNGPCRNTTFTGNN